MVFPMLFIVYLKEINIFPLNPQELGWYRLAKIQLELLQFIDSPKSKGEGVPVNSEL